MKLKVKDYQAIIRASKAANPMKGWLNELPLILGKTKQEIEAMPLDDMMAVVRQIKGELDKPMAIEPPSKIKLGYLEFKIEKSADKMTAQQFIDATEIAKDNEKLHDNFHLYLAVWWQCEQMPDIQERAKHIQEFMPMQVALETIAFFLQQSIILQTSLALYLEQKEAQKIAEGMQNQPLQKNGSGSLLSKWYRKLRDMTERVLWRCLSKSSSQLGHIFTRNQK